MDDKCSVWVGSLSLNVKEDTLSDYFGKFGPLKCVVVVRDELGKSKQFGFVHYYSSEVAECAATVMDGCDVLGQAIKTKGPRELQKMKNEENGRRDYRVFTDCLFFIDDRHCTWKSGECPFRHCNDAKKTETVCEKWLEKQCEKVECPNRHPRLTKALAKMNADNTIRCPSHNAFKCFGKCGNKDCNTHFLEYSAYEEHVKMAMKKLSQPVDICLKCQAVFFNQDEKVNHRCYKNITNQPHCDTLQQFTSTRMQAEKDVAHPQPLYPNKANYSAYANTIEQPVSTQLKNKSQGSKDIKIDKKYSSIYDLKDSSRISNLTVPKQVDNSGKMKQSTSQKLCDVNNVSHAVKELEPVGVFWDFENCSVPKGKSAQAVVQKIRKVFFKYKREVEFMCVCDTSKEKKAVMEELNKAQVTVVHINATSKNAADDKLRQSLRRFAQTFSRPATVILISGDGNFAMDLSDLRHRHNFHIVCLHNIAAAPALLSCADQAHRFDLFTEDIQTVTTGQTLYKPSFSNDVLITNLPVSKSASLLKARLTKLSDNCGGKVVSVNGNRAIVRFPNTEAAFRARRRLDKEDLFGSILNASLLPATNNKECTNVTQVGKRKQRETSNTGINQSPSTLAKPLMDLTLNDNPKRWKENQTPNCINQSQNFPKESFRQNTPPLRIPEQPATVSPQFTSQQFSGQRFHGFPGNFMHNNMFHPTLLHSMFGIRGGDPRIPNSPIPHSPIATISSPFPSPHSVISTSPSSLNSLVSGVMGRSPTPEQQHNGVDLLVTNINENVSKKEIKKKLASVFREHCKVYSVVLHAKNGAPLRGFVKVPKLMDAHQAISKVNRTMIFGQVVHVSVAGEKDKELCYLQDEVVTVLQDAPLSWLPLCTFFTNFEKKYRRRLDSRHLEQLQDVVVINGSPGCQTVSLVEGKIDSETVVVDDSFSSDVFKLLHHYDGVMMYISFPALYWLEFHKDIKLYSSGSVLEELLCQIPNVTVVETAGKRCIQWVKKPGSSPCDLTDLSLLTARLVHILQQDHEFEMTFERLQDKYLSSYETELDHFSFGFQSLADFVYSLSSVVQVMEEGVELRVSLVREFRVQLFQKEIEELLEEQPNHTVLLYNFMALYVKHFGKKFKISSFGFTRLIDLIKAVSNIAVIEGIGDLRTVTLIRRKDEEFKVKNELEELSREIEALLDNSEHKEMQLNCVLDCYFEHHGEQLSCTRFGCQTLDDLLSRLSNTFQVVERGNDKCLRLRDNIHSMDEIKADLFTIVNDQENKYVRVRNIFRLYEKIFRRKFPYEISLLNEALESIDKPLQVLGNENDRIIIILKEEERQRDVDFLLFKTAVEILYHCEEYCLPKDSFQCSFEQNIRKKKNIIGDDARLGTIPSCVVVQKKGLEQMVGLKPSYCIRILVEELKQLLGLIPELSLSVDELTTRYEEHFKKKFNLESHGLLCSGELKEKLNGFIEVTSSEEDGDQCDCLALSPISRFELETSSLLANCGGCLSLSRFAPVYLQMFSKPCIVSDYGYTKLSSLINAVPHVSRIIGSGPEKVIIAVERSIPERVCSDMLSVRIIGGSTEQISSFKKDKHVLLSSDDVELDSSTQDSISGEVSQSDSPLPDEKIQESFLKDNKNLQTSKKSKSSLKLEQNLPETVKTMATPSSTCKIQLSSSAGQGKTTKSKYLSSSSRKNEQSSESTARATPSKIRLAANFKFPLNDKK